MADVLRSYLVDLGFRMDESGLRRFSQGLQSTHHVVRDFAVGIAGMAVGAEEAIRRTAKQFENLFYLSQQTTISVTSLKSIGFAFDQIGLSAGEAQSTLAGFTSGLRDNPGLRAFVNQYVPGFEKADTALLGVGKRYKDLLAQFGDFSAQEAQFRGVLRSMGLDPDQVLQTAKNYDILVAKREDAQKILLRFGLNSEQAAAQAVKMNQQWGLLWFELRTGLETFASKSFPAIEQLLHGFTDWLRGPAADAVNSWARKFDTFINDPKTLKAMDDSFGKIRTGIEGISRGLSDWIEKENGLQKTSVAIQDIATNMGKIVGAGEWIIGNWANAARLLGETSADAPGMPRATPETERRMREHGLPTPLSRYTGRGDVGGFGIEWSDVVTGMKALTGWIAGIVKGTPWIKIENTSEPILVDFSDPVFDKFAQAFRDSLLEQPAGGGGGSGGGYHPAGRFGGMSPGRMRPIGFNPGASGAGITGLSEMVKLAKQAGFSDQDAPIIASIAMAESSGRLGAVGGAGELGLTQINPHAWGQGMANQAASSPLGSFQAAKTVLDKQGWGAWTQYTSGKYRQFLGAAQGGVGSTGSATGMDPSFKSTLDRAFNAAKEATGETLSIFSGFRDHAKQMRLFLASDRSGRMVARPGHSMHEHGLAADIRGGPAAMQWMHQHAREQGLNFPMGYEPWHVEPLGARSSRNVNVDSDHKVEINVHGAADPHGTAAAVRDAQDRHSSLHAHNLRTAIA